MQQLGEDEVWSRFCGDVQEAQREDVLTIMSEAAHGDYHDCIQILERDKIDAINVRLHGIIQIGDNKHAFILESGNWRGTVLEAWGGDFEFKPLQRTEWTLQPTQDLIAEAMANGRGEFLLKKWDAMVGRPEIARIPRSFAYDVMVQPGLKVQTYWRAQAAKHHFEIVSKEHADETRARLRG